MEQATIIGSGPAGLSLAYFLSQREVPCTIISADDGPGGLAQPLTFAGRLVDPGPHSFYSSYDPLSFGLLRACFRADELHTFVPRRAIRTSAFAAHSPLHIPDLMQPRLVANATIMALQRRNSSLARRTMSMNARERVLRTRGRRFLELLFDPWCLKHFGMRAEELDASLVDLLAAERRAGDAGCIVHPRTGAIGELWQRLAAHLAESGVSFRWRTRVSGLERQHDRVVGMTVNGAMELIQGPLFSSAPIATTAAWLGMSAPVVPKRSTTLLLLLVERYRTDALYLTDHRPEEAIGRIAFCDNWRYAQPVKGPLAICVEFWCSPGDGVHDRPVEDLVHEVQRYLHRSKVAVPLRDPKFRVVGPMPTTPVPVLGYAAQVEQLRTSLDGIQHLHPMGRHANHRWDGVDDAIREAHALASTHA